MLNEWMNEWTNERMNERMNKRMNERINEWMNERINEWMNEWMNEWITSSWRSLSSSSTNWSSSRKSVNKFIPLSFLTLLWRQSSEINYLHFDELKNVYYKIKREWFSSSGARVTGHTETKMIFVSVWPVTHHNTGCRTNFLVWKKPVNAKNRDLSESVVSL